MLASMLVRFILDNVRQSQLPVFGKINSGWKRWREEVSGCSERWRAHFMGKEEEYVHVKWCNATWRCPTCLEHWDQHSHRNILWAYQS